MSTQRERDAILALGVQEWHVVEEILAERGETWPDTDTTRWGAGLHAAFREVRTYATCLEVLGVRLALDRIEAAHAEHCPLCAAAHRSYTRT